jgi:glyoxylase I family protein
MSTPGFLDHLVFRVADLARTERFYTVLLGEPSYRAEGSVMWISGETRLFFSLVIEGRPQSFDKENVGLNHLAFGVRTLKELQGFAAQLDAAAVTHSGIKIDRYGKKEYIWLDDPDGMRVEFYLREE